MDCQLIDAIKMAVRSALAGFADRFALLLYAALHGCLAFAVLHLLSLTFASTSHAIGCPMFHSNNQEDFTILLGARAMTLLVSTRL